MDSHGTSDLESFKAHGKNISCIRSSIVQAEESVSDFSPEQGSRESDTKSSPVSQHDELEKYYLDLAQNPSEANDEERNSMCQIIPNTGQLDRVSSPDEVGQSICGDSNFQCHDIPSPAVADDKLPQCAGESNAEKGDPVVRQISRTKGCDSSLIVESDEESSILDPLISNMNINGALPPQNIAADDKKGDLDARNCEEGKYFYYDTPLCEETGAWIPVSVPPMCENDREEWTRGCCSNGGYIPEEDMGWNQYIGEDKELTMWDVVVEMLLVARGKLNSLTSGDIVQISWISTQFIEQAWKEMAQTLTEANFSNTQEILESEPPKWLPDSSASSCMLCSARFHPIMCTRHHCRFCGGIFCNECTKGRSLLPENFRTRDPQRVCDVCCVRLESVQPYLMNQVSRAAQFPTHDLTDLSTLRSWVNFPWGQSMEYEIYKAANTIRSYARVGLRQEKRIPEAIIRDAKGLAILTVVKVGIVVTYNVGTGLVVARREDGSWSPPSAISSFGVGWGAQAGGELIDFIIVLRTYDAVKTFCSDAHVSIGAGMSAAVGIIGRTAEADLRAGDSGFAACYTYSCSKGAFIGCSLEGSVVTTRTRENSRFYGNQSLRASEILVGSLPQPPAAATLYRALEDLYMQVQS
ncbi:RING/FYVE/PHD-type zinc finger family protein [Perilla frutescens var. hirtella]|nr:RING/FYVE/PHD-type zinc finger family protein [Perilla frutescens var. frutescens]KAH6793038.1 RING/FYVE/PHD-type zinc finger family protein [Perilla frutescens var. hirtella]